MGPYFIKKIGPYWVPISKLSGPKFWTQLIYVVKPFFLEMFPRDKEVLGSFLLTTIEFSRSSDHVVTGRHRCTWPVGQL